MQKKWQMPSMQPSTSATLKTDLRKQIGYRVKQARIYGELTMDQACDVACVSRNKYGAIERGESEPSASVVLMLARAAKVPVLWIMFGDDVPANELKPIPFPPENRDEI